MSGGGGSFEATSSSRWPKVEVLALIKLRSGLEQRYQEAGPKGPLWEEISAGMHRMGYKRNPKRCKEKWENINKYYKKVKESNKKRPEDAKTCPYFHELDALYRKKILGGGSTSGGGGGTSTTFVNQNMPQQQQETIKQDTSDAPAAAIMPTPQTQQQPLAATTASENKNGASTHVQAQTQSSNVGLPEDLFGEGIGGAPKKVNSIPIVYLLLRVKKYWHYIGGSSKRNMLILVLLKFEARRHCEGVNGAARASTSATINSRRL